MKIVSTIFATVVVAFMASATSGTPTTTIATTALEKAKAFQRRLEDSFGVQNDCAEIERTVDVKVDWLTTFVATTTTPLSDDQRPTSSTSTDCLLLEDTICASFENGDRCDECDKLGPDLKCRFPECPRMGCGPDRFYSATTSITGSNTARRAATEVGACTDVSNDLVSCVMEHCSDADDDCDSEGDDDDLLGDADLTDCDATTEEMCNIATQTAENVGLCCPQCAEITYDYFVCFVESTYGSFCPDATCGEWTSDGDSGSGGTLVATATGAVMAIGLML